MQARLGACLIFMPDTCEKGLQEARRFYWGGACLQVPAGHAQQGAQAEVQHHLGSTNNATRGFSCSQHWMLRLGAPAAIADVLYEEVQATWCLSPHPSRHQAMQKPHLGAAHT